MICGSILPLLCGYGQCLMDFYVKGTPHPACVKGLELLHKRNLWVSRLLGLIFGPHPLPFASNKSHFPYAYFFSTLIIVGSMKINSKIMCNFIDIFTWKLHASSHNVKCDLHNNYIKFE